MVRITVIAHGSAVSHLLRAAPSRAGQQAALVHQARDIDDGRVLRWQSEVRMGVVQLPDELERVIERQVAEGRADSPAAFLEEAVRRLVDDTRAEEDEVRQVAEAGVADTEAGRYTTMATEEDGRLLQERLMTRLRARLAADG